MLRSSFFALARLRNWCYDREIFSVHKLPGFCVSVGNLAFGGTGKSPVVVRLAQFIREQGGQPVILTRGYRSSLGQSEFACLMQGQVKGLHARGELLRADEARMQSHLLPEVPVVLGRRRYEAALWFMQLTGLKPTHWILDDGFQHRRLARDLDIVLVDAGEAFSGLQREGPEALARAQLVLVTRSNGLLASVQAPNALAVPFKVAVPQLAPTDQPVLAVAGIAKPRRFLTDLDSLGVKIATHYLVGDHRSFQKGEILKILQANPQIRSVVTTEKDYWRDPSVFEGLPIPVFRATIDVQLPLEKLASLIPGRSCLDG